MSIYKPRSIGPMTLLGEWNIWLFREMTSHTVVTLLIIRAPFGNITLALLDEWPLIRGKLDTVIHGLFSEMLVLYESWPLVRKPHNGEAPYAK